MSTPTLCASLVLPSTEPRIYRQTGTKPQRWRLAIWVDDSTGQRTERILLPDRKCRMEDMLETAIYSVHDAWSEAEGLGDVTGGGFELWRLGRKRK